MNISYISVFRDRSGYSRAAVDYVLAMNSVGLDVSPLTLKLNDANNNDLPKKFFELENKPSRPSDVVIQHYLPSMMESTGKAKTVGLFAWETDRLPLTWARSLNEMVDEVWVINRQQAQACRDSGVKKEIHVVPHAVDVSKFQRSYEPFPQIKDTVKDSFVFYTVCEFNRRKNLEALLRAFHTEFDPDENVELILKINKEGLSQQQCSDFLSEFCKTVKNSLRKFSNINYYKKDITITNKISEESMLRLHSTCDCFISTSFGEAWCLPAMDALGLGKSVITPSSTGFLDYLDDNCAWLVPTYKVSCFGSDSHLYNSCQNWWSIDILEIQKTMRCVYTNSIERTRKSEVGMQRVYDFSFDKIGNKIKTILNG